MRNSAEETTYTKDVMENFQERQMPRDDKWRNTNNIHREESECKTFDTKRSGRN